MAVATELLGLEPGAALKEAWDVSSGTCEGGELLKPSRKGSLPDELTSEDVLKFKIVEEVCATVLAIIALNVRTAGNLRRPPPSEFVWKHKPKYHAKY